MTAIIVKGTFTTIVADPPWPYDTRVNNTRALPAQPIRDGSRLQRPVSDWTYEPMALEEIRGLSVPARKDAHLYLWTTNAFMSEAYEVVAAWGFTPKTIITWGKIKRDTAEPSMKTGYWFRGATEHCIFATRGSSLGKPKVAISTLFLHPRISMHSSKPDAFYTEVVERISPGPYLEMFARNRRDGWTVWGNQIQPREKDDK